MLRFTEIAFWASLVIVVYSYLIYPGLLTLFARVFGRPASSRDDYLPDIGVLVPAYNEEKVIARKINNILSLDYPPEKITVWVGSDSSDDATDEIVKAIAAGDPRVRFWRSPRRGGKTGIINGLVPRMDSEIVLLTDANTMHRPGCLRAMAGHFVDPAVGGVAGHIEHKTTEGSESAEAVYRRFESHQKVLEGRLHSAISAFGGSYAIRRGLFRPIPQNAYSNDDVLIPMSVIRQGCRVIYEAGAVAEEDMTDKVSSEFQRRVRIGAGNFQAFFWLLDFFNPLRGWPWFCYVSHKVTRWFSPFFIMFCFASCLLMAVMSDSNLYKFMLSWVVIFSLSGLTYRRIPLRINRHIFYFFAMNLALLLGSLRFAGGIRSAVWKRTERV